MRSLHRVISTACIATLFLATPLTAAESQPASLWQHNSSVMALYASGPAREFRYHEPRVAMQQEGVTPGTLLFSGIKAGNLYSGIAYIFSRRCGAHPYQVNGTVSDDGREISMLGTAPATFDPSCRPILYRQDALVFTFLQSTACRRCRLDRSRPCNSPR